MFLLLDLLLSSQSSRNEKISGASLSQVMKTLLTLFVWYVFITILNFFDIRKPGVKLLHSQNT